MNRDRFKRAVAPLLTGTAIAAAMAVASMAQAAPQRVAVRTATHKATLATFAGTWFGHTRGLTITRAGHAKESIGDGCCDPVVDLHLKLSQPRGNSHVASVAVRVTSVQIHDHSAFSSAFPAPHVGQRGRLRLRYGVITEPITNTNYCNEKADMKGTCGA